MVDKSPQYSSACCDGGNRGVAVGKDNHAVILFVFLKVVDRRLEARASTPCDFDRFSRLTDWK